MDARYGFTNAAKRILSPKEELIERIRDQRLSGRINLLDAAMELGRFTHSDDTRHDKSDYFEAHNMQMMIAPEIYPELEFLGKLTDYQRTIIATHDVTEKFYKNPQKGLSPQEIERATLSHELAVSTAIVSKKPGQKYFPYFLPICRDNQINEMIVKACDTLNNKYSNPKPEREKIYDITSPYIIARIKGEIGEGFNPLTFLYQQGQLKDDSIAVFLRNGGDEFCTFVPKPANDRTPS